MNQSQFKAVWWLALLRSLVLICQKYERADCGGGRPQTARNRQARAEILSCRESTAKPIGWPIFMTRKWLVVVFTCNHCPTAQAYEDRIIQLHRDYKNRGVAWWRSRPTTPRPCASMSWATPTWAIRSRK